MMKRSLAIFPIILLSAALVLAGCAPAGGTTPPTAAPAGGSGDLMAGIAKSDWSSISPLTDPMAIEAINRFAAALLQSSVIRDGNVMISPASVYLALAMTANGADTETLDAMLAALSMDREDLALLNEASRSWIAHLNRTGDAATVRVSNGLWFDEEFVPDPGFLAANADYFGAAARKLDFRAPGAPATINQWVSEETEGLIDGIIQEIDPAVVMYLINTLYFKADWQMPFDPAQTRDRTFETPSGAVETPFMHRTGDMTYFQDLGATGVALPYLDSSLAFFALLPDGGTTPRDWLAAQDSTTLFATISRLSQQPTVMVDLALPAFEVRDEDSLLDELTQLGLGVAFDPGAADFSKMNESRARNVFISDVLHKTYIRVDEKGTEAAAVTSVEISLTSLPVVDQTMTLDHPFVYGVLDLSTGTPLFVGLLEDPSVLLN